MQNKNHNKKGGQKSYSGRRYTCGVAQGIVPTRIGATLLEDLVVAIIDYLSRYHISCHLLLQG